MAARAFSNRYVWLALLAAAGVLLSRPGAGQTAQHVKALADMRNLAQAMDFVALDTTFYVSLENLNDVNALNPINDYDSIQDEGGPWVMLPDEGLFLYRRNLATAFNAWNGPYQTYQSGTTQTGLEPYDQGSPLDPWGTPYYLFNPLGLIRGDEGIITQELYGDAFDRYVIVSLGPDGVMSTDDLSYVFGGGISGTHLTSIKGEGVTMTSPPLAEPTYDVEAGTTVTLRGWNFGTPGPTKTVMFGPTVLTEVVAWGPREIDVVVPETLHGTAEFRVKIGSGGTNSLTGTITGSDTRVEQWQSYE